MNWLLSASICWRPRPDRYTATSLRERACGWAWLRSRKMLHKTPLERRGGGQRSSPAGAQSFLTYSLLVLPRSLRTKIICRIMQEVTKHRIEEEGLEKLSLRDVARRLGVSHQAPYEHFPSCDHLFAELVIPRNGSGRRWGSETSK